MAKQKQHTEAEQLSVALGLLCKKVQINGETVIVRKFKLRDMSPVYEILAKLGTLTQTDGINAGQMIASFPELAAELIARATGMPDVWVNDQEVEDAGELLAATMEVNARFFTGEAMVRMFESLGKAFAFPQTTTETTSPNSSPS